MRRVIEDVFGAFATAGFEKNPDTLYEILVLPEFLCDAGPATEDSLHCLFTLWTHSLVTPRPLADGLVQVPWMR